MAQKGKSSTSFRSFNTGEMSPFLDARGDLDKYNTGCKQLKNAVPLVYGPWDRRQGMKLKAAAKFDDKMCVVIEFEFSVTTTFAIEMGEEYMRFYTNGAQVEKSSATAWSTTTGYVVGDYVDESGTIYYCIEAHTSGTFATDLAANKWVAQTIYEIPTPYQEAELLQIQYEGINDIVYFAHNNHPQRKLTRLADDNWSFSEFITDAKTAFLDENLTDTTLTPGAVTGSGVSLVASDDLFDSLHVGSTWKLGHERDSLNTILPLAFPTWLTATDYEIGDGVTDSGTLYRCLVAHTSGTFATDLAANKWTATEDVSDAIRVQGDWTLITSGFWRADILIQKSADGSTNWKTIEKYTRKEDGNLNVPGTAATETYLRVKVENWTANKTTSGTDADAAEEYSRVQLEVSSAILNGIVEITAVTDAQNATCTVIQDLESTDATEIWCEGAWSDYQGYPAVVCFHEERIFYAASTLRPNRIWASESTRYETFTSGTDADSGFFKEIGGQRQKRIEWMVSQKNLLVGTNGGESIMTSGSENLAITPANAAIRRQSANGSKSIRGLPIDDVVVFINRDGRKVREMISQINPEGGVGYQAPDLTLLAEHIAGAVDGGFTSMAFQQQPEPILWLTTAAGTLVSMTYDRDQNVTAFTPHPTEGSVESVAVITGEFRDEVWMTTKRTIDSTVKRFIEQIEPEPWFDEDAAPVVGADGQEQELKGVENAFYVDCGLTITGPTTTVSAPHLPNTAVHILVDGAPLNDGDNIITLDGNGEYELEDSATTIHVGLGYETIWEPMRIEIDATAGDSSSQEKCVYELEARVINSVGITYGDGDSNAAKPFDDEEFRDTSDLTDTAVPPFTGPKKLEFDGDFDIDNNIIIKQTQPLPLTLVGVVAKYKITGDK